MVLGSPVASLGEQEMVLLANLSPNSTQNSGDIYRKLAIFGSQILVPQFVIIVL